MTSANWLVYALSSLLLYGFWGLFSKLATHYLSSRTVLVYDILGAIVVGVVFFATNRWEWQGDIRGILFAVLTGIVGTVATLCYLVAVSRGSSSIVLPLTALYPAVTVVLAFFILKEPMSLKHAIGILLAILAIVLCSSE